MYMEPRLSGPDQTGNVVHSAPQQGSWSMQNVSQTTVPGVSPTYGTPVAQPGGVSSLQADDGDLIEREWIEAVKKVINESREDPFAQCQALTLLKLQYIKKRYGTDIKVPE